MRTILATLALIALAAQAQAQWVQVNVGGAPPAMSGYQAPAPAYYTAPAPAPAYYAPPPAYTAPAPTTYWASAPAPVCAPAPATVTYAAAPTTVVWGGPVCAAPAATSFFTGGRVGAGVCGVGAIGAGGVDVRFGPRGRVRGISYR
jgi:hypothetical protein